MRNGYGIIRSLRMCGDTDKGAAIFRLAGTMNMKEFIRTLALVIGYFVGCVIGNLLGYILFEI